VADVVKNDIEVVKSLYSKHSEAMTAAAQMLGFTILIVWDEGGVGTWVICLLMWIALRTQFLR